MNMTEYDVVPDSNSGGNMTCESLSHKLSTMNLDDPEDARRLKVAAFFYSDRLVWLPPLPHLDRSAADA